MPPKKKSNPLSKYFAKIGAKGGSKTGPTKARDPEKMKEASRKAHEAKRLKKQNQQQTSDEETTSGHL